MLNTASKGIGYQDYRNLRINEGISRSRIEDKGYERYLVYWGRSHIVDHESGVEARGMMKFGRGKFATALMRGRNEGGADFRIYAEIIVEENSATHVFERKIGNMMSHRQRLGSQGQEELYDIKDEELEETVRAVAEVMDAETHFNILEVNLFHDNKIKRIRYNKAFEKKPSPKNIWENLFTDEVS